MATVKAIIRKDRVNTQGLSLIYIQYGHRQKTTLFSTGIKVKPIHWNTNRQMVDSTKGVPTIKSSIELIKTLKREDSVTNAIVNKLASEIRELSKRLMMEEIEPTIHQVKLGYDRKRSSKEIIRGNIFELFQAYIDDNSQRLADGTLKQFKVLQNHLSRFEQHSGKKLLLESLNKSQISQFMNYLVQEKGLINDSVNSNLKRLKTFLKHLSDEGYLNDRSFERVKPFITTKQYEKDIVYVTYQEFEIVRNFNLINNARLDRVRDLFIVGCTTGLRFGDLMRVTPAHLNQNFIEITTEKTRQKIVIPITKITLGLLDKYQNQLPTISNQKFNKYLKELAKLIELKTTINRVVYKGNEPFETRYEKHELISSHSMRRTFVTVGKKLGMTTETIMQIVGHSSYEMTKRYQEIDKETLTREMKVWDDPSLRKVS